LDACFTIFCNNNPKNRLGCGETDYLRFYYLPHERIRAAAGGLGVKKIILSKKKSKF
jgi:hypothetical protein